MDGMAQKGRMAARGPLSPEQETVNHRLQNAPSISRWTNHQLFCVIVPLIDFALIVGGAYVTRILHLEVVVEDLLMPALTALPLGILGGVLFLLTANGVRLYTFKRLTRTASNALWSLAVWGACLLGMSALGYLFALGDSYPRTWTLAWATLVAVALVVSRIVLRVAILWATRRGLFRRRLAVVGATPRVIDLVAGFADENPEADYEVVGIFDDRINRVPPRVSGIPVLGTVDDLLDYCRRQLVDVIVIALPWAAEGRNATIVRQLRELPVDISLVPDLDTSLLPPRGVLWLGEIPTMLVSRRPLTDEQLTIKWLEDKALGLMLLVLAAPLMLMAALAVKLTSKGPILFEQERFGFNQKTIRVLKFRSMYVDKGDVSGQRRTVRNDPRVTPVGRIIRRFSIDELPQLLNVLKGDMSIVGPRAHAVAMTVGGRYYDEVVAEYAARHRVKPGITGWAQINGSRGEIENVAQAEERLRFDLYYVDNWSLLLDLRIIAITAFLVLFDRQAY